MIPQQQAIDMAGLRQRCESRDRPLSHRRWILIAVWHLCLKSWSAARPQKLQWNRDMCLRATTAESAGTLLPHSA
eukprot:4372771-Amphidinium_carterae.2